MPTSSGLPVGMEPANVALGLAAIRNAAAAPPTAAARLDIVDI
jgi:hypothetical protein